MTLMERSRFETHLIRQPTALFWQLFIVVSQFFFSALGWHFRSLSGDLAISSIWPAAGLSIAILVLFGKRAIYAIFLGNLLYELFYPNREWFGFLFHFVSSFGVAFGQTLGAYVGMFFLRRFLQRGVFYSVSDSSVFLVLTGLVSSIILPFFFLAMISFDSHFHWELFFPSWFQVWVSNVSGVFIFAPVLIVWGRNTFWKWPPKTYFQIFLFVLGFIAISFLAAKFRIGLIYLYLPWLIWITFTLGQLGATMGIFLFSIITLFLSDQEDLTFVIAFVDIVAATILILLGALEENISTQNELKEYSANLESKIHLFTKEQMRKEDKYIQKNANNALSVGIAHQLHNPILKVVEYSGGAETCADILYHEFQKTKPVLSDESFISIEANFKTLQTCLKSIKDGSIQAAHLLKAMNQQSSRERGVEKEFKAVDLPSLLNSSLGRNLAKQAIIAPDFKVNIVRNFSPRVGLIMGISGDLDQTFYHLFDNALYAMKEKQNSLGKQYKAQLVITTEDRGDNIEIIIEDNGIGIPPNALFKIFQPFFTTKSSEAFSGIGLSIAFEITEKEHHGKIEIDSNEGQFTRVKITLPKAASLQSK